MSAPLHTPRLSITLDELDPDEPSVLYVIVELTCGSCGLPWPECVGHRQRTARHS